MRNLSDYNGTRTQNHLVRKRTLNHFAKLAIFAPLFSHIGFLMILEVTEVDKFAQICLILEATFGNIPLTQNILSIEFKRI